MTIRSRIKTLVVPDLHCPFEHQDALDFLAEVKRKQSPDVIVCLGDELDMHAMSDFEHDPDGMSAGDELAAGIKHLLPFYQLFPKARVCTSNHTRRPYRKAYSSGMPRAFLRDYAEWMQAPTGWEWADEHIVDECGYSHGEGFSGTMGALKMALSQARNWSIGHLHADAGIMYQSTAAALIWAMNCGWLGDRKKYAMRYGQFIPKRGILGCGIVNRRTPILLPMYLDRAGRWLGPKTL